MMDGDSTSKKRTRTQERKGMGLASRICANGRCPWEERARSFPPQKEAPPLLSKFRTLFPLKAIAIEELTFSRAKLLFALKITARHAFKIEIFIYRSPGLDRGRPPGLSRRSGAHGGHRERPGNLRGSRRLRNRAQKHPAISARHCPGRPRIARQERPGP